MKSPFFLSLDLAFQYLYFYNNFSLISLAQNYQQNHCLLCRHNLSTCNNNSNSNKHHSWNLHYASLLSVLAQILLVFMFTIALFSLQIIKNQIQIYPLNLSIQCLLIEQMLNDLFLLRKYLWTVLIYCLLGKNQW